MHSSLNEQRDRIKELKKQKARKPLSSTRTGTMRSNERFSPGMIFPSRSVLLSLPERSRCTGFMSAEAEKCSFTSGSEALTIC